MKLELYSKSPSDSVTAICLPASIDGVKLRVHLEVKLKVTVMGGQDQLKGKIIRIGHMGYILDEHMQETMQRFAVGLKEFGYDIDPDKIKTLATNWLKTNK